MGRSRALSNIVAVPIFLLAALLQTAVLPAMPILGTQPNLVLLLVVCWSLAAGWKGGVAWAIIGGVIIGLFAITAWWLPIVALALASAVALLIRHVDGRQRVLVAAASCAVVTFVYDAVTIAIGYNFDQGYPWLPVLTHLVLPAALLNAVVALALYPVLRAAERRAHPQDLPWGI